MTRARSQTSTTRRAQRVTGALAMALVVAATTVHPGPATAASAPPAGPVAVAAPGAPGRQQTPGDPAAGPYDPGFVDAPLGTNPPSPSLDDVALESDELDQVRGLLDDAEDDRDAATAHRDERRRRIEELGEDRVAAVEAVAQRQAEERQRGVEREAAVEEHARRVAVAEAADDRLEVARDDLRDLVVSAYVNESSARDDSLALMESDGDISDPLMRLAYSRTTADGRLADVEERVRLRQEAVAAEERAAAARAAAEQAEVEAVAARQAAEQHVVDVDAETVRTQQEEVEAVAALADREADVLLAAAEIAPARLRADITIDGIDFPLVALDAWLKAAATAPCRIEWWALAGISKVEGRHGTHGGGHLGARGYPTVKIIGPQLNGGAFAEVGDTDGGRWDGDPVYDRAVGPMQFIPQTWSAWGRDGDGDLVADPFTVYDAAAGAAAYLCAGRADLTQEDQLRSGYFSYNHSQAYVEIVLSAARGYQAALQIPPHVVVDPVSGEPIAPPPVAQPGTLPYLATPP